MTPEQTTPTVKIRFAVEADILLQIDAIALAGELGRAAGPDASVSTPFAASPNLPEGHYPMMGVEAVIASIALPSLALVAKAVRDVILEHLKAKANATVEIETPDGRRVKITGPEARSDRVLEILQEMAKLESN